MELSPRPYRHLLRVRYGECDGQQVVFNARYGEYVDVAFTEYVRALGYGTDCADPLPEIQLVKQTTEWFAPSRNDEMLELTVASVALGNSSFTVRTEFRKHGDVALRARSETIYVHVDPTLWKKAPLPERLRCQLAEGPAHA
ncbi:MAG: thioesterase family protein [Pseudomonadota bacterium]